MAVKPADELPGMPLDNPQPFDPQADVSAVAAKRASGVGTSADGRKMYVQVGEGRRLSIPMDALQEEDRKLLKELDVDGNANVSMSELIQHSRAAKQTEKKASQLQKIIGGMALFILLLTGMMFAVNIISIEATKEMRAKDNGVMKTPDGDVVKVGSNDLTVGGDGTLVRNTGACPSTGRRLQDASFNDDTIKTTPTLQRYALSSHLPDSMLMALDEFVVYSDKGHTLHIKAHGFARIPVLNSRCGNVVHFYTAWNGRVTLDASDLSFDEATAKQFEGAGFSLAVGGGTTRRLQGSSSTDGFFKHISGMAESNEWTCGDVALPQMATTHSFKEISFKPCGATIDKAAPKTRPDLCDSMFGGFVVGSQALERDHSLAIMGKASRMRAQIKAKATSTQMYARTEMTIMKSPRYEVEMSVWASHPGQEKITVIDRDALTDNSVTFQLWGGTRTHCDVDHLLWVQTQKAVEEDSSVDSDMHFEYMDMFQENGTMLRHFRMMPKEAFLSYMGATDPTLRPAEAYTEYWDFADTLAPYRLLTASGSLILFDSYEQSCTDDDIKAFINDKISHVGFSGIWSCDADELRNDTRPTMRGPYEDLQPDDVDFYTESTTYGNNESAVTPTEQIERLALSPDTSNEVEFAKYLVKLKSDLAMPDMCYVRCEAQVEAVRQDLNNGRDECATGTMQAALECVQDTSLPRCTQSQFLVKMLRACEAPDARRMAEAEINYPFGGPDAESSTQTPRDVEPKILDAEMGVDENYGAQASVTSLNKLNPTPGEGLTMNGILPSIQLADGSQKLELWKASTMMQHTLKKAFDLKSLRGVSIIFNMTDQEAKEEEPILGLIEQPNKKEPRRLMMGHACPKSPQGTFMALSPYAWCIRWDATPWKDFKLEIMWGRIAGFWAITITCQGCQDMTEVWGIPDPAEGNFCVFGTLGFTSEHACPGVLHFSIYGRVGWSVDVGLDLWIVSITFAKFEVGIVAATTIFKEEHSCAWHSPDSRRRRRWWSRRRRNWRSCQYRDKCDVKVGLYARIQIAIARVEIEVLYYILNKAMMLWIHFDVFEFWLGWWGGWKRYVSAELARYQF